MSTRTTSGSTAAAGLILFAAVMAILGGVWQFFAGLVALLNDEFYVVVPNYVLKFDVTTWGWIHLLIGVILILVGVGLLVGQAWARWTAIVVAGLSALAAFFWLPWYPLWAILIIALDVFIIWALAAHGRALTDA